MTLTAAVLDETGERFIEASRRGRRTGPANSAARSAWNCSTGARRNHRTQPAGRALETRLLSRHCEERLRRSNPYYFVAMIASLRRMNELNTRILCDSRDRSARRSRP